MSCDKHALSEAIVLYLEFGIASFPARNPARVFEVYGEVEGQRLLAELLAILEVANSITIDWKRFDLSQAGQFVRAQIKSKYPCLNDPALDAVKWKFTFDWR